MSVDASAYKYGDCRECRVVSVVRIVITRGAGGPDDVVRPVTQFWTPKGEFIVEIDPWPAGSGRSP